MTDELRHEIELLKAQVAALTDERLPKVDRASKRRDRRQVLGGFGMFAIALLMAGTLSASALAGSNTVTSDDIVDNGIYHTDIRDSNVTSVDVKNNALTGDDINEATLSRHDFFAQVKRGGGVVSASPGVTAERKGTGDYLLTFPVNTSTCAASYAEGIFPGAIGGFATQTTGFVHLGGTIQVPATTQLNVNVVSTAGTGASDRDFLLTLTCP